jgi:hypothetical protein
MFVTAKVTLDIDPKKWRNEYGLTAAETGDHIRSKIQLEAETALKDLYYERLGLQRDAPKPAE